MFVFLTKKIAIPNDTTLHSISWHGGQGWIACGGDSGLLKVLKMETAPGSNARGIAAPTTLTMNQTLNGHQGKVLRCTWNSIYKKLTTSDENGLIVVWMLHRGMWFEEMINNRSKSVVRDMRWSGDGQKICIAYEDGAVILGGVDGNRLWAKELGLELRFVQWSPDSRQILFGDANGDIFIYDNSGNMVAKLPLYINSEEDEEDSDDPLVGIEWYNGRNGSLEANAPDLAIALKNGKIQITRGLHLKLVRDTDADILDRRPILIDTGMQLRDMQWNHNGSVLAVAGYSLVPTGSGESKKINMLQFYSSYGQHLRTLKIPGNDISSVTWDGSGLRMAIAVDANIYFAAIRPEYNWVYYSRNTLCFATNRPERHDSTLVFWDMHCDEKRLKHIKRLVAMKAADEACVIASRNDDQPFLLQHDGASGVISQYSLTLYDAIGSSLDNRVTSVDPHFMAMTSSHVIIASDRAVYLWQYRSNSTKKSKADSNLKMNELLDSQHASRGSRAKQGRERLFHIDNDPSKSCVTGLGFLSNPSASKETPNSESSGNRSLLVEFLLRPTNDAITCVTACEHFMIIGRESGTLVRYSLPHIAFEASYVVNCRPQKLSLNCNHTRLSIIDIHGVLTFLDLDKRVDLPGGKTQIGELVPFERKDTWDVLWADDNPEMVAVMDKTKLYLFRGTEPEEPVLSSGYLCKHADLRIMTVMLDDLMQNIQTNVSEAIMDFPTKSLRDAHDLLKAGSVDEALAYIESHPHPRLWRVLAEVALARLEFPVAEKAFVHCSDYSGIQFVKSVKRLNDKKKQQAQVATYFDRFDEAETIYRDIDRKDLAIELRIMLGDWFRVVQLLQSGGGAGDDDLFRRAWNEIGDYFAARQKWRQAVQYYASARNAKSLVDCYYALEEYESLAKLIRVVPESDGDLLKDIGKKFQSVGLSESACDAFIKAGDVKAAIDCCVMLNHWETAIQLAQEHDFPQIEGILSKYASQLLEKGAKMQAIELYRKAKKSTQAATLLKKLAEEAAKSKVDILTAKKLHVLAAMEMEELRNRVLDTQIMTLNTAGATQARPQANNDDDDELYSTKMKNRTTVAMTAAQATAATLDNLMQHDAATGENRSLDNAWRGAEAYHLYMMAQRQLYNGNHLDALTTAIQLRAYDDYMNPKDIHCLIAFTAYVNKAWGQCSRAFVELESMKPPMMSKEEHEKFSKLAIQIFTENRPVDPPAVAEIVATVEDGRAQGHTTCMASGKTIDYKRYANVYKCRRCTRKMIEEQLRGLNHCPLCHMMLL